MFRKDNSMMESAFGTLKFEMFYGVGESYQSLNKLEQTIVSIFFILWNYSKQIFRKA